MRKKLFRLKEIYGDVTKEIEVGKYLGRWYRLMMMEGIKERTRSTLYKALHPCLLTLGEVQQSLEYAKLISLLSFPNRAFSTKVKDQANGKVILRCKDDHICRKRYLQQWRSNPEEGDQ